MRDRLGDGLFVGATTGFQRLQVVVTAIDPVQPYLCTKFVSGNLVRLAKGIAGALYNQGRRGDRFQVRGAWLAWPAGAWKG